MIRNFTKKGKLKHEKMFNIISHLENAIKIMVIYDMHLSD